MVEYIQHNEIDKKRWDQCIKSSGNELPYAYSWYLDLVSPGWDALILDNYNYVMPLCRKSKFGINYLFVPYFTQQLGIFSKSNISDDLVAMFLKSIPDIFRYADINLNEHNPLSDVLFSGKRNINYEVDLNRDYQDIFTSYSRNCKRNLKKANDAALEVREYYDPRLFVDFVRKNLEPQLRGLKSKHWRTLFNILITAEEKDTGEIYAVYTPNGTLCAAGSFLNTANRCIFSVCASTALGKNQQAMYCLVDYQINKYAQKKDIFDFSGSNLSGVAYFNRSFGAEEKFYNTVSRNNLPRILKILKK
ncbi:MAG: hypothetical protein JXJ22_12405 [Bacteroidales bacterium]|nr:hypothetical protein [Bacteroidales bacterium]